VATKKKASTARERQPVALADVPDLMPFLQQIWSLLDVGVTASTGTEAVTAIKAAIQKHCIDVVQAQRALRSKALRPSDLEIVNPDNFDALVASVDELLKQNHGSATIDIPVSPLAYKAFSDYMDRGWEVASEIVSKNMYRLSIRHPLTIAPDGIAKPSQKRGGSRTPDAVFNSAGDRTDRPPE
jgi:hypothetical protein